jgi:methylmalonyl-CoA mutase N-terminal domain/subunit
MTRQALTQLRQAQQDWAEQTLRPALEKLPANAQPATLSGMPLQPLYGPLDFSDDDYPDSLGFPGQSPYTRGVQPTMYRAAYGRPGSFPGMGRRKKPTGVTNTCSRREAAA